MPDGLYTSVSQVKCWLRCPRQFELKYVRGVSPAFVPVNLAFGSAIHEALAAYYGEQKTSGTPLRRDLVFDVFRAGWDKALDGDVPLQLDEDGDGLEQVVDKGVSMLHAFYEHASKAPPFEVEAVEHGFTITLHDPYSGAPMEEQLVGTMDLVIREGPTRVVVEHKTAARRYTEDQLRFDVQPTAYKIAARESGLGDVALRFQVVTKTKVPVVQVAEIHRDAGDEVDFTRIAAGVLKAIDAGVSYPVRGWACRSCPFSSACR
jgi:putative RecB family exonuclease